MYKQLRKSVAGAISTVEGPEQFQWNKWLKVPQIYYEKFPKPRIEIKSAVNFREFTTPSLFQVKKFSLTKFKVSEEIKNVVVNKRKTFKVFFTFPKTYHKRISIFEQNTVRLIYFLSIIRKGKELFIQLKQNNKESIINLIPKSILIKINPIQVSVHNHKTGIKKVKYGIFNCILNKPENLIYEISVPHTLPPDKIFDLSVIKKKTNKKYLALAFNKLDNKPLIKDIPVISLDEMKSRLKKSGAGKVVLVSTPNLNQKPKQYRVKSVKLEKNNIPIYHLKNLQVKEAKQKLMKFELSENRVFSGENPILEKIRKSDVIDPGILNQLNPAQNDKVKKRNGKVKFKKDSTALNPAITKPTKTIKWDDVKTDFKDLHAHQKEGIKLLLTNKTALLCDELGIDKKIQAIYALDTLIKHKVISKALIVCPDSHIGNKKVSEKIKNSDGWENQIFITDPSVQIMTIRNPDEMKSIETPETNGIYITNYKTLIESTYDSSRDNFYKYIECLILDEAQYLLNVDIKREQLFNFPESRFHWILTSLPSQIIEERLIPKLTNHLVGFEKLEGSVNRTKQSLGSNLPEIIRNDYWHELDVEQAQEFENTLIQGRKRILDLLKGGNPFIIQSNIFTLIHQIKQLGNFSTHKETSPKTELLLDQLESIIASGKKAIIFSQYDKQGIQKIERLLKNNQIRYVLYQSGMPLKELDKSTETFKNESKISVMLAGMTAASVKTKLPEASYLIHFDQWWNPINQWQYEDKTLGVNELHQSLESVNVINYFSNNSVEMNIRSILEKKGLLTKDLIEFLSNDTIYNLITNEDWLDILGVEQTKSLQKYRSKIDELIESFSQPSLEEYGQKVKTLFSSFGYQNLIIKPNKLTEELTIYGTVHKGIHEIKTAILCLPFNIKNLEPIQNFIKEASKNNNRLFVVCSDEIFNQVSRDIQNRIAYIGQRMFVNYLSLFNMI